MSVTYSFADGVALIQMDDGKANALSHGMLDQIEAAFDKVEEEDGAKAVVLAGRDGVFCGGFDVNVILGGTPDEAVALFTHGGRLLDRLLTYPRPLVTVATGHAVAMGAFLLLASDYRIGAKGAFKLGFNESAKGIEIPYIGIQLAQERLSPLYLTRTAVLGELFDPETAVQAGLLDQTVAADQTIATAQATAAILTALHPAATAANKNALRRNLLRRMKAGE